LLQDARYWIAHKTYSEDEIAVRFHHKLVWIHAFPNGNGRHARLMTDVLLEDVLSRKPFSWDVAEMDDDVQVRNFYIDALRKADNGDYAKLLEFIRSVQTK